MTAIERLVDCGDTASIPKIRHIIDELEDGCDRITSPRPAASARGTPERITDPVSRDVARLPVAKTLFDAGRRDDARQLIDEVATPRCSGWNGPSPVVKLSSVRG